MVSTSTDQPTPSLRRRWLTPKRQARLLGLAVALVGVVNVVSALTPGIRDRLDWTQDALTPDVAHLAAGATALLGVALLLLGRGLAHRRRLAFVGAVVLLIFSTFTHILKGLDFEEAVASLLVAVMLVASRRIFTVETHPARYRTLALLVPIIVGLNVLYGLAGLLFVRSHVEPDLTVELAFREIGARVVGMTGPLTITGSFGHWFPASITILGFCSVVGIVLVALAPIAERVVVHHSERDRVRRLINRADGDSLDPFALRHDKQYVFSEDGTAAVAYRYVNGVGLASGDPVGEPESFPDALDRFIALCQKWGWRVGVLGVRGDRLGLYEHAGLRTHYLGDEALIDVAGFTLEGRAMRPVRQAYNRTKNFHITTEIHREGELEPTLRRALIGISDRHRAGAPERGFSMALDELLSGRDADCVVVVARDAEGAPMAFQRYVPCRAGRGLSLDAMRRDAIGPNGVNERMIVEAVLWAKEHGLDSVSLNFAAFKGLIEEGADRSMLQSVEAWFIRRVNPYFQIETLLTFNAKFHPRWVPRYLAYESPGDLAPVAIAALSAEAFLPFDRGPRVMTSDHPSGPEDEPEGEPAPLTGSGSGR
ncbi:MAG: phosphatidylglycerol lysyltransferase domain-containing protein [Acidimicrobiia bacterium]